MEIKKEYFVRAFIPAPVTTLVMASSVEEAKVLAISQDDWEPEGYAYAAGVTGIDQISVCDLLTPDNTYIMALLEAGAQQLKAAGIKNAGVYEYADAEVQLEVNGDEFSAVLYVTHDDKFYAEGSFMYTDRTQGCNNRLTNEFGEFGLNTVSEFVAWVLGQNTRVA